jgi:hypothetical protein
MTRRAKIFRFVPGLLGGLMLALLMLGTPAGAYHTNFKAYCNDTWWNHDPITRGQARDYTYVAGRGSRLLRVHVQVVVERAEWNDPWFRYHTWMQNVHGPYTASDFKYGLGAPNTTVPKANTVYMDAFASVHHIGMIYWANTE